MHYDIGVLGRRYSGENNYPKEMTGPWESPKGI